MAVQFLGTRFQSFKTDGTVNAGGTVYFYDTGTSTAKTTYSNSALSVANANPVVLDSAGCADIWYSGDADVTVKDSTGTTIDSFTSINPAITGTTTTAPNMITNGSFETLNGTEPDGWDQVLYTAGTGTQNADSIHGLYSWKFTSVGSGGGYLTTTDTFNVAYNRPILLYWDMYSSVADVRNVVDILWYDDTGSLLSTTSAYDDSTTNPTTWTRKYYSATPVANAVNAKIRMYGCHSSDATSGSTYYDNLNVLDGGFLGCDLTVLGTVTMSGKSLWFAEGTAVASANDCNIWTTDGNTVHITGATEIQDWGTAPQAGAIKWVIFDSTPQLTYNATTNKLNTGGSNYTAVAGDRALVYAESTSSYIVTIHTFSGASYNGEGAANVQTFTASGTWTKPSGYSTSAQVRLQAWGGGGSGGAGNSDGQSGGGGGGGAYKELWKTLSELGATETITVGAGGTGVSGSSDGVAGGNTTIGSLLTAYGGGRGGAGTAGPTAGAGGGGGGFGGAGGNATSGGAGTAGITYASTADLVGGGGSNGGTSPTAAADGRIWGGGGGGGGDTTAGNATGIGGDSIWGGGGGGGAGQTTSGASGGTSIYGGNGGAGATGAATATSGSSPGGGGGGAETGTSGAGGDGKVIITVFA